eukprot:985661-Pyramimonas_sp.AAC.1
MGIFRVGSGGGSPVVDDVRDLDVGILCLLERLQLCLDDARHEPHLIVAGGGVRGGILSVVR